MNTQMKIMEANIIANITNVSESLKTEMGLVASSILNVVDGVRKTLEQNHDKLEARVAVLETSATNKENETKKDLADDFAEQKDQIRRLNNLIIKGIPESEEGEKLLLELLKIILPKLESPFEEERVGAPASSRSYPRPIRLPLTNNYQIRTAFSNCKKLKGVKIFEKISVCRDLTKKQQAIVKAQREASPRYTRSVTALRGIKRRNSDTEDMQPNEKKQQKLTTTRTTNPLLENDEMETHDDFTA